MSSASVTMIGWMRKPEMSAPLKRPAASAASSPSRTATPAPASSDAAATADAIAITDPTERSMPPVAMTKVMPTATSTVGETCRRTLRKLFTSKKFGVSRELATRSRTSAASAP
jgi:hypothetical protein